MENLMRKGPYNYFRKSLHTIAEVLEHVEMTSTKKDIMIIDGDPIKIGSDRYKIFKFKGLKCVKCDLEAQYFAKECSGGKIISWHMNLYAINADGREVLFTKDHIYPKSLGGKNEFDNYQPMCSICNCDKGSKVETIIVE